MLAGSGPSVQKFERSVAINASPAIVWEYLTDPVLMNQWMPDEGKHLDIRTDWKEGSPITIQTDWYKTRLINRGKILKAVPESVLRYTHLSSISRLPDKEENYTIIEFRLEPDGDSTALTLTLSNFPTESIYKHLAFYWSVTLGILKEVVEKGRFES